MDVAPPTEPAAHHDLARALLGEVGYEPALRIEDQRAHRYLEREVGAFAAALASARPVRAGLGLPARTALVDGQVGQLVGRLEDDRPAPPAAAAVWTAAGTERFLSEGRRAAPPT